MILPSRSYIHSVLMARSAEIKAGSLVEEQRHSREIIERNKRKIEALPHWLLSYDLIAELRKLTEQQSSTVVQLQYSVPNFKIKRSIKG